MDDLSGYKVLTTTSGKQLEYFLGLPRGFDAGKTYRTILVIPPGDQTRDLVAAYSNWFDHFTKEGWVMVCPITPDGKLFFQGSERYLPHLMNHLQNELIIFNDKFYLMGVSNGGITVME